MKLYERGDVGPYAHNKIKLIEQVKGLDFSMDATIQFDLILHSLLECFDNFITNFNVNKMEYTIATFDDHMITL